MSNRSQKRVDQAEFLRRAKQAHPEQRYSYAKSSTGEQGRSNCNVQGLWGFYDQAPQPWRGGGCPSCARDIERKRSLTKDQFVSRSKKLYEIEYDYSFVRYKNAFTAVTSFAPFMESGGFFHQIILREQADALVAGTKRQVRENSCSVTQKRILWRAPGKNLATHTTTIKRFTRIAAFQ